MLQEEQEERERLLFDRGALLWLFKDLVSQREWWVVLCAADRSALLRAGVGFRGGVSTDDGGANV